LSARWDDGEHSLGSDGLAQVIGVIGRIGHDDRSGQPLDQCGGLRFASCEYAGYNGYQRARSKRLKFSEAIPPEKPKVPRKRKNHNNNM
jgi:hypothetical protein